MNDFDVRRWVRDALNGLDIADPHLVTEKLMPELPKPAVMELAQQGLFKLVVDEIRLARMQRRRIDRDPVRSAKWLETAKELSDERGRIAVPNGSGYEWKFRLDLTADDCLAVAAQYEHRAEANLTLAKEFRTLADRLTVSKCKTVRDLLEREFGAA